MSKESTKKQIKRAKEAAKSLQEIQKKIAPFTKPRKIIHESTAGKWETPTRPDPRGKSLTKSQYYTITINTKCND